MSDILLKVLSLLLVTAALSVVIRGRAAEYSFLLTLACAAAVLLFLLSETFPYINKVADIFRSSGNETVYFKVALKALGIAYITNFAADICRDFGQSALASYAELAGKFAVFALSVPMMCAVLQTALKFADV